MKSCKGNKNHLHKLNFIFIGPRCPWGPIYGSGRPSVTTYKTFFADLTDVTLAVDDSNLVPSDDFKRAILGNVEMQVVPSDGQY